MKLLPTLPLTLLASCATLSIGGPPPPCEQLAEYCRTYNTGKNILVCAYAEVLIADGNQKVCADHLKMIQEGQKLSDS